MNTPHPVAYAGTLLAPKPPMSPGWRECTSSDQGCSERASSLLPWLPPWHYVDAWEGMCLRRYFCWLSPWGSHVSAMQYEGDGAMGAPLAGCPPGLVAAANALLSGLQAGTVQPTYDSDPTVLAFQQQWNQAGGTQQLTEDGKYGGCVFEALSAILQTPAPPALVPNPDGSFACEINPGTYQAPNCGSPVAPTQPPTPSPTPSPTPTPPPQATSSSSGAGLIIGLIALAAVGAGGIYYASH